MKSKNDNKLTSTTKPKKPKKTKPKQNELSKQLEQEQNHRNGDHMEGYQQGSGWGKSGERYRE